jgi:hypothetical protein
MFQPLFLDDDIKINTGEKPLTLTLSSWTNRSVEFCRKTPQKVLIEADASK